MDDVQGIRLESLLRDRIGLNPQAVHRSHIDDAVRERMAACGVTDLSQYLAWLESRDDELPELIERLVVVESWFFRDVQPFSFLEKVVRTDWKKRDQPLRVLSVPCGGGEEPYSIAMTLLNLGLDAERFRVDGVDISQRALRHAREGSYGESSFREAEEPVADFRSRFFRTVGALHVVNDEVKASVRIRHGNLVESGFLYGEQRYDMIFCRNLLIYLDADARHAALANLHRLLAKDGILYVGHVEGGTLRGERFDGYDAAYPFAFRVRSGAVAKPAAKAPAPRAPAAIKMTVPAEALPKKIVAPAPKPRVDLDTAREAANRGELDEAAQQCLELLKQVRPSAAVYCLLGVIRQAQGELGESEKCFHKALYLDPRHHESLVHLALLATQRGEETAASNYRRRAEKAKVKQ